MLRKIVSLPSRRISGGGVSALIVMYAKYRSTNCSFNGISNGGLTAIIFDFRISLLSKSSITYYLIY
jgi:hypothetical protein